MTQFNSSSSGVQDDTQLYAIRRDISAGINTRMQLSHIGEQQAGVMDNIDVSTPGEWKMRPGSVLLDATVSSASVIKMHNFDIQGGTDQLLMFQNTNLSAYAGSGNWTDITPADAFSAPSSEWKVNMINGKTSGLTSTTSDDVTFVFVDGGNWNQLTDTFKITDLGNTTGTSASPPRSSVAAWYGNRWWVLLNDLLYFSAAYSSTYSSAFDTVSDIYRVPVGEERGIAVTRDTGMVIMGQLEIWGLAPSTTPAATDKPQPLVTNHGVVSRQGWVNAGDDIYYFAQDGFRALRRTIQDKLQSGITYPVSYYLKTEYDAISWANINKLSMEYFDNKIFISVPTGANTFSIWIYHIATNAFTIVPSNTWNVRSWAKYKITGEERFYYGKHNEGGVYRAWNGTTDEGTSTTTGSAVNMIFEGREEDFGQPLIPKLGGEIEVESAAVGDYDLVVEAKINGGAFTRLGSMNLASSSAPTLPVALPFNLSDDTVLRTKFPIDKLGSFRTIQARIQNSDTTVDTIKVYGVNIVAFPEQYQGE